MNDSDVRFNRWLAVLILASFIIFAMTVVLRLGLGATPYDTTSSTGQTMGFNDLLDAEHYAIMIGNFQPAKLFRLEYAYEWLMFMAHLVGAWLLLSADRLPPRLSRWFFAVQAVFFPLGFLALPFMPFIVFNCFAGRMDREGFVDIPFIWAVAHPVWVITALVIAFAYRGAGVGLARLWGALVQAAQAGTRTFVNTLRQTAQPP